MQSAFVLLHGRSIKKGEIVLNEIYQLTQNEGLKYYNGDFASLEEVKNLGEQILRENDRIDILINNVGIGTGKSGNNLRELSKEGFELRLLLIIFHMYCCQKSCCACSNQDLL